MRYPRKENYRKHQDGLTLDHCPYANDLAAAAEWFDGFMCAEVEAA